MKTFAILLTLFGTIFSSVANTTTPADELTSDVAITTSLDKIKLYYVSTEENNVKITLFNEAGKEIASKRVRKTEGFIQPFNTLNLKSGVYTFEIEDSNGITVKTVNYDRNEMRSMKSSIYPVKDGKKFSLQVVNNSGKQVTIKVLDSDRNVLHEEKNKLSFRRIFNLENVEGAELISVSNGEFTDYHVVTSK